MSDEAGSARIDDARRAGFYPLVLLLERLQPEFAPVGSSGSPLDEGVRFRHTPDLSFSAGDIVSVERRGEPAPPDDDFAGAGRSRWEITTSFLGLTGCVSPLPSYVTEELLQDDADSARARDFLDLFHHRLLSLLYRALTRFDLPDSLRGDSGDAWSQRLLALLGFDGATAERGGLPPHLLLRLSSLLGDGEVTAQALEVALTDLLAGEIGRALVSVEQFVGTWAAVDPSQLTRLGQVASQLGCDLLLGRRVFDRAGKFRITVGPLTREEYARLAQAVERGHAAAGGHPDPLRRIEQVVAALLPGALEHEIVLWLKSDAAPALQLTASGRTRLGRNSWLGGQSREARITVHAS